MTILEQSVSTPNIETESWTGYQVPLPAAGSKVDFGSVIDLCKLGPRLLLSSAACIDLRGSFVSSSPVEASPPLPLSPSASQALPLSSSASNALKSLRAATALVVLQNCPCSFLHLPSQGCLCLRSQ